MSYDHFEDFFCSPDNLGDWDNLRVCFFCHDRLSHFPPWQTSQHSPRVKPTNVIHTGVDPGKPKGNPKISKRFTSIKLEMIWETCADPFFCFHSETEVSLLGYSLIFCWMQNALAVQANDDWFTSGFCIKISNKLKKTQHFLIIWRLIIFFSTFDFVHESTSLNGIFLGLL